MIRPRRRLALALVPLGTAFLLSLQGCEQLFPEHPVQPVAAPIAHAQPSAPGEPAEHADTPEEATRIVQGAPQSGSFESADDVDFFAVEVAAESHLYVSTDQGAAHHAQTTVSVQGPGGEWSDGDQDVLVPDAVPGTYHIKVEPATGEPGADAGYDLAVWTIGPANDSFDIQLRYVGIPPTAAQKHVFEQAAAFWESALEENERTIPAPMKSSSDRCQGTPSHFGELVDDLLINVQLEDLDGHGHTLAVGGYCIHRLREGRPDLPVIAIIKFDTADIGWFEAERSLRELAIHEMAHALGFGMDLWRDRGYLHNPTIPEPGDEPIDPPPDTYFSGPQAGREFQAAGGTSQGVPVENDIVNYREGSLDSHWREQVFENEIMTANVGANALISRVTLGSLEDLGYAVNYEVADPYRLSRLSIRSVLRSASGVAPAAAAVPVADDIYPVPPRPLELPDELVEALLNR